MSFHAKRVDVAGWLKTTVITSRRMILAVFLAVLCVMSVFSVFVVRHTSRVSAAAPDGGDILDRVSRQEGGTIHQLLVGAARIQGTAKIPGGHTITYDTIVSVPGDPNDGTYGTVILGQNQATFIRTNNTTLVSGAQDMWQQLTQESPPPTDYSWIIDNAGLIPPNVLKPQGNLDLEDDPALSATSAARDDGDVGAMARLSTVPGDRAIKIYHELFNTLETDAETHRTVMERKYSSLNWTGNQYTMMKGEPQ